MADTPQIDPTQTPKARGWHPVAASLRVGAVAVGLIGGGLELIPVLGAAGGALANGASHLLERSANGIDAKDEIAFRANYYRDVVAAHYGISPEQVTVEDFIAAAQSDPTFAQIISEVKKKEADANRESLAINSAVTVAGLIPGVGLASKVIEVAPKMGVAFKTGVDLAKYAGAGMAGSKAASLFAHEDTSIDEIIRRIHTVRDEAEAKGIEASQAITPELIFALRVAQDHELSEEIKKTYGKSFFTMSPEAQTKVMAQYPALANAVTSEAYAIANRMLSPQDLAARRPNLNSNAAARVVGERNASFAQSVARRPAPAGPSYGRFTAALNQRGTPVSSGKSA